MIFKLISSADGILTGIITPGQRETGGTDTEEVLHTPQGTSTTATPLDAV